MAILPLAYTPKRGGVLKKSQCEKVATDMESDDRLTLVFEMLVERLSTLEQSVQKMLDASEHTDLLTRPGRPISGVLHCGRPASITRYFQGMPDPGSYLLVTCPDADFTRALTLDRASTHEFPHGPPRELHPALREALGDAEFERVRRECLRAPHDAAPDVDILGSRKEETGQSNLTAALTELALRHRVPQFLTMSAISPSNILLLQLKNAEDCTLRSIMRQVDGVFDGMGLPRSMDVHLYIVGPACLDRARAHMQQGGAGGWDAFEVAL